MSEALDHIAEVPPSPVDSDLLSRAVGGDESARLRLVERSRRQVHGWCCSILGDPERAEDATQETLIQLWRHIGALREPRAFPAWLYRMTLNACRRQFQRNALGENPGTGSNGGASARRQASSTPTPEALAVARDELEQLLKTLRSADRAILAMKYGEDLSAREIGNELSISEGAARTRLHAIIAKLRRLAGSRSKLR